MTRCLQLCNPGSIRLGLPKFEDEMTPSCDDEFRQFSAMKWGIRAIGEILLTYQKKYQLRTIREIITRYAPPSDNNPTEAYIQNVADRSGLEPDATLDMTIADDMNGVITGIIDQEQAGLHSITPEDISEGVQLALA